MSIYIHIPFCKSICSYCDFAKILYRNDLANVYLDALEREIDVLYENEKVDTIYIGGGTPSLLEDGQLDRLNKIVKKFNLKDMGVNRLSIGIESFNKNKLEFMHREANFEDALSKIKLARTFGYDNINVDLIYGISGESLKDLKKDLNLMLKLEPDHVSTYSLIIEGHTMCKIRGDKPINAEEEVKMYEYIVNKLTKKGYIHYEVSNFAKPSMESKHNLTYWNNQEYYGFGLGASGYIRGFRYTNTRNIDAYINGIYKLEENLVSKTEMMENEVMLGLRKTKGINLQEFFDKYEVNMQDVFPIKPLVKSKELIYKDGYIYINPKYIYVMNEILLKLV